MLWFTVIFILLAFWLARGMVKRQSGSTRGYGIAIFYWFVVNFALIVLFFPFVYWLGSMAIDLLTGERYQAEIVSYLSAEDTCDDDGDSYDCTKYVPVFAFSLEDGRQIELPGDIRSTALPEIGKTVSVVYEDGAKQLYELSLRSIGILIGGTLMLMIEGYFLLLIVVYVLGYDTNWLAEFGISTAIFGLVPLGASFMFFSFGYALYEYVFMDRNLPLWVVVLCGFFMFGLLPLLYLYLRALIESLGRFLWGGKNKTASGRKRSKKRNTTTFRR